MHRIMTFGEAFLGAMYIAFKKLVLIGAILAFAAFLILAFLAYAGFQIVF